MANDDGTLLPPQVLKTSYQTAKSYWRLGKERFQLFSRIASKFECVISFGVSKTKFSSVAEFDRWCIQNLEKGDTLAAPYVLKTKPLVLTAIDGGIKLGRSAKRMDIIFKPVMPVVRIAFRVLPFQTATYLVNNAFSFVATQGMAFASLATLISRIPSRMMGKNIALAADFNDDGVVDRKDAELLLDALVPVAQTLGSTLDTDGDGVVTKADLKALPGKLAAAVDLDGDGKLSFGDLDVVRKRVAMAMMDLDGDSQLGVGDLLVLKARVLHVLDVNGDGRVDGMDLFAARRRLAEALDVNGDGRVDAADMEAVRRYAVAALDGDGDGAVGLGDLAAWRARLMSALDADGDGILGEGDVEVLARQLAMALDADGNGELGPSDAAAWKKRVAAALDVNGDGALDARDLAELRGRLLASTPAAAVSGGAVALVQLEEGEGNVSLGPRAAAQAPVRGVLATESPPADEVEVEETAGGPSTKSKKGGRGRRGGGGGGGKNKGRGDGTAGELVCR